MFYPNWIHCAYTSLEITKSLNRLSENEVIAVNEIIKLWNTAYRAPTIKDLANSFGTGLSMFLKLDDNFKADNSVYVQRALAEVMNLCNKHKLRVTFDVNGPIFY